MDNEAGEHVFELFHPRRMNEKISLTSQDISIEIEKTTATAGTIHLFRVPYSNFNHAAGCIPSHLKWMIAERNRYEKSVFHLDIEMEYCVEDGGVLRIHYTPSIVV